MNKRLFLLSYASNGKALEDVLPDMVVCRDAADYEQKCAELEKQGGPPTVFIVPDVNSKKICRHESEIDYTRGTSEICR